MNTERLKLAVRYERDAPCLPSAVESERTERDSGQLLRAFAARAHRVDRDIATGRRPVQVARVEVEVNGVPRRNGRVQPKPELRVTYRGGLTGYRLLAGASRVEAEIVFAVGRCGLVADAPVARVDGSRVLR